MSDDCKRLGELEELLGALREGVCTDSQWERLNALLLADPEARQLYLEHSELCSILHHYQGHLLGAPEPAAAVMPSGGQTLLAVQRPYRNVKWLAAAAVLLAAGITGGLLWHARMTGDSIAPEAVVSTGPPAVAVLSRTVGARWHADSPRPRVGRALPQGRLKLNSGLAQLEFFSGATVVLEGPADLELLGPDRAYCRQGKIRVTVQPSASGFVIETPKIRLVDRGTEFGLSVAKTGEADVHVFEGKVELYEESADQGAATKHELIGGGGAHVDRAGVPHPTDAATAYVGTTELAARQLQEQQRQYQAWLATSRKLSADPRVLLYYSFEDQKADDRRLRNRGRGLHPELDGAIIGCEWTSGRWPKKRALDFKRQSDRIRFTVPGQFDSLTWMAWVRVDALEHRFNALLLTDGFEIGAAHWQFTELGALRLGVRHVAGEKGYFNYDSPPLLPADQLGEWQHVATVYDATSGVVEHYLNGEQVASKRLKVKVNLALGPVELGNWGMPREGDAVPIRNLNGRIDEFTLFKDALMPEEIFDLYRAGDPAR